MYAHLYVCVHVCTRVYVHVCFWALAHSAGSAMNHRSLSQQTEQGPLGWWDTGCHGNRISILMLGNTQPGDT